MIPRNQTTMKMAEKRPERERDRERERQKGGRGELMVTRENVWELVSLMERGRLKSKN